MLDGSKRAPLASPGFGDGEGRGGANVHTALATSSPLVWEITTEEAEQRLRSKKKAKNLVKLSGSLIKLGRQKEDKALWSCGRYFDPFDFPCGTEKLVPYHCRSPLCADCARFRAKYYERRIWDIIRADKTNYFMITFTIKNVRVLTREAINKLIRSFAALREEYFWNEYIEGGFYSIETTHSRQAGWHPHEHCLVKAKCRLPKEFLEQLKERWRAITGDSDYIYIERVYGLDKKGQPTRRINRRAIKELVKYTTKSYEFCEEPELVGQFLDAFKHVRRLQSFGCFFNVSKTIEQQIDPSKDKAAYVGCRCGKCRWCDARKRPPVHITQTFVDDQGERHTKLEFARGSPLDDFFVGAMSEREFEAKQVEEIAQAQDTFF